MGVPNFRKNLALNIRARRGKLTQKQFARKLGIDQASVNRIELGEQNVTIDTLQLICDRLKCDAGDLLDD
ncbi:helix-turn-helix domain-containing protein [Hyphococcus sp.]|uniref:helix-turn-helix domain-containing protein n=1 Tax=Hyphococcus sp. TaxID=2038636 RepID=UPI003D0C310D